MPRTKDFNETEVLEKALRTFWCQGYEATTTRDLAEAAGISYGSLYHSYRDKRTLFLATLDYYQQRYVAPFLEMFKADGSPREIIRQFVFGTIEADLADTEGKGCFLVQTTVTFAAQDPEIAGKLKSVNAQIQEAYLALVERAKAAGEIDSRQDSLALAQFLMNTITGIHVGARGGAGREALENIAHVALAAL
jgi:TetR/AcrR family transcriptional repressor of nem operon